MPDLRPRLTPAVADVRRAVRVAIDGAFGPQQRMRGVGARPPEVASARGRVLVALSGGADSLALAAATAFEAPRAGIRAGAVVIDHGLQDGSDAVAARAAEQARALGLEPVVLTRVDVGTDGGPEGAARTARYRAFARALAETGASHLLLAHTLDDQAETVLLGLARGSGAGSLKGMAAASGPYLRPLLGIRRATTRAFCRDAGLEHWEDPQNADPRFARVRVRQRVLPLLERELGPGVAEALARTADQAREDSDALHAMVEETVEDICEHAERGVSVSVAALQANPAALRHRIIRYVADSEFGAALERVHVLAIAALAADWHGQAALDLPGFTVLRSGGELVFQAVPRRTDAP